MNQIDTIIHRLERIEAKLDSHLERVSAAETSINWIQGHLKIATAIVLSALGGMATILVKYLFKGAN
jgi:hypothetical protein